MPWGVELGLGVEMISSQEVLQVAPHLRVDDLAGALWVDEDAQVSPVDLCAAYASGIKQLGGQIEEGQPVERIVTDKGKL